MRIIGRDEDPIVADDKPHTKSDILQRLKRRTERDAPYRYARRKVGKLRVVDEVDLVKVHQGVRDVLDGGLDELEFRRRIECLKDLLHERALREALGRAFIDRGRRAPVRAAHPAEQVGQLRFRFRQLALGCDHVLHGSDPRLVFLLEGLYGLRLRLPRIPKHDQLSRDLEPRPCQLCLGQLHFGLRGEDFRMVPQRLVKKHFEADIRV